MEAGAQCDMLLTSPECISIPSPLMLQGPASILGRRQQTGSAAVVFVPQLLCSHLRALRRGRVHDNCLPLVPQTVDSPATRAEEDDALSNRTSCCDSTTLLMSYRCLMDHLYQWGKHEARGPTAASESTFIMRWLPLQLFCSHHGGSTEMEQEREKVPTKVHSARHCT